MEQQLTTPPSTVASISGHPTAGFSVTDAEAAAAQLNGSNDKDQGSRDHHPGEQSSVYTSDPSLTAAMPDDDTSPMEAEDDDGLEHPADNAPFSAPPKDYRFSPWEELKTHSILLYSLAPLEVKSKSMATVRLKVPTRLESYTGPVEVSPPEIRHRLDHGLVVVAHFFLGGAILDASMSSPTSTPTDAPTSSPSSTPTDASTLRAMTWTCDATNADDARTNW